MNAWVFLILASTVLYKWVDEKGRLHVTDRLTEVPPKYRAKFVKLAEQAEARKKKALEPQRPAKDEAPAQNTSAYGKWQERQALEKKIREKASALREDIGRKRKHMAELEEERGNLASNPVLNAAQPARKQRMEDIDAELQADQKQIDRDLGELQKMLEDAPGQNIPDEWITANP